MKRAIKHKHYRFDVGGSCGFTLIEVMFCVWLLAFIVVALFRMQSGSIHLTNSNTFNQQAPELASQLLSQISNDLENWSKTQGDFGQDYPGITWACIITEAQFDDTEDFTEENFTRLKKIDLKIQHTAGSRTFSISSWRFASE